MIIGRSLFNIYLLPVLLGLLCGCHSTKNSKEEQLSTLALHLEVVPSSMDFSMQVSVFREKPILVTVDKEPFITEAQVSGAKVLDELGGYVLQISFLRRGAALLEQYTTTNPGKHIAIVCGFGEKKTVIRWIAAPLITRRLSSGTLTFTPDCTREEAEEIALGLNNLAKQVAAKDKW
ncbi:MAG: SecDF P1 head subdomain-containing protein [Verrucomicrobiota bacterium]